MKGIRTLDQVGVDVMIVGRGGGSMEYSGHLMKRKWPGQFLSAAHQ